MENSPFVTYGDSEKLSREERPRAILEWPKDLSGVPVIYPLGGSDELDDQIRTILEQAFTRLQADRAGIQDERPAA